MLKSSLKWYCGGRKILEVSREKTSICTVRNLQNCLIIINQFNCNQPRIDILRTSIWRAIVPTIFCPNDMLWNWNKFNNNWRISKWLQWIILKIYRLVFYPPIPPPIDWGKRWVYVCVQVHPERSYKYRWIARPGFRKLSEGGRWRTCRVHKMLCLNCRSLLSSSWQTKGIRVDLLC
jgi:hypothetical protein